MKGRFKGLSAILFISFSFLLTIPFHLQAKEYEIPELDIEVQVNADGSIHITEHRTYVFDGSYSWANYRLPKSGYSRIDSIRVSENGNSYVNRNSEEPGTFLLEESGEAYNIKWYYEAEDEQRVFTISYTLTGALTVGPEWSQFFWNYAASGREKSTDNINISLELPSEISATNLHYWIRQPDSGVQGRFTTNGFLFDGQNISKNESVRIRSVFPTLVFNNSVTITDQDFSLDWVRQDEQNYQEELALRKEREAYLLDLAVQITIVIGLLSLTGFIFLYRKFGTRHKVTHIPRKSLVIPGRIQPAVIGWLMAGRNTTGGHVMATLLDLARKEYFTIHEQKEEKKGWGSSDQQVFEVSASDKEMEPELTDYERTMIEFVRNRIDKGNHKLEDIFKYGKSEVSKWFSSWKKEVKAYCQSKNWYDPESFRGMYWNFALQFLFVALSIVAVFFTHEIALVAVIITLLLFIFSFGIIRRTPRGEEVFHNWKSYREALKHAGTHSMSGDYLEKHFIYAVAFGLGKTEMKKLIESNPQAMTAIYWIVLMPGSNSSPADIAQTFSTLSATGAATAGGGAGAGASAGAAGGGASGGAG